MDTMFVYNKSVTGAEFISRKMELASFKSLIKKYQDVVIYEPPKSGKRSFVKQAILELESEKYQFSFCEINLFNIRSKTHLLQKYFSTILNNFASSPEEFNSIKEEMAPEASSYFGNQIRYKKSPDHSNPELDSLAIPPEVIKEIINLPEELAKKQNINLIVYTEEFQEILQQDDPHKLLKTMEQLLPKHQKTTYVFTGSMVNSMKRVFEEERYFYNMATRVKLNPLDINSLMNYYKKQFLKTGRVVSNDLAIEMHRLTCGHPWYAQQLGEISYGLTRGYLTPQVLEQSFLSLLELHSYRYQMVTSRLSRFQVNFLKAVIDNVKQLSSAETIAYYGFNSSANVKRLKDAVKRKEILTEENGKWIFLDPLFEVWLKRVYFDLQ